MRPLKKECYIAKWNSYSDSDSEVIVLIVLR